MLSDIVTLDLDRVILRQITLKLHRFRVGVNAVKIFGVGPRKLSQQQSLCFGNLHGFIY
jgi:hypothetical protein